MPSNTYIFYESLVRSFVRWLIRSLLVVSILYNYLYISNEYAICLLSSVFKCSIHVCVCVCVALVVQMRSTLSTFCLFAFLPTITTIKAVHVSESCALLDVHHQNLRCLFVSSYRVLFERWLNEPRYIQFQSFFGRCSVSWSIRAKFAASVRTYAYFRRRQPHLLANMLFRVSWNPRVSTAMRTVCNLSRER